MNDKAQLLQHCIDEIQLIKHFVTILNRYINIYVQTCVLWGSLELEF